MDGVGCAVLFLKMGGLKENIRFVGPQSVNKVVTELCSTYSGHLLFADVSVDEEHAKLLDQRGDILILDHHKTALHLSKYPWATISVKPEETSAGASCGTLMMWEHFLLQHSEIAEYEGMARMIDDYDRWIHKNPMSQKFADLHSLTSANFFIDKFLNDSRVKLDPIHETILEIDKYKKEEYFNSKINDVTMHEAEGLRIGVIIGTRYISECCHHILNNHPSNLDVIVMINPESNQVSLRGKTDNVDVSKIAALNGGGGHTTAAGFYLSGDHALHIKDKFLKNLKLPPAKRCRKKKSTPIEE
jgi:oligoribonuclease NrnB/cAMP/cGMP phosphodiesterase (DHH superfamily)